jgi:hypothetical protein
MIPFIRALVILMVGIMASILIVSSSPTTEDISLDQIPPSTEKVATTTPEVVGESESPSAILPKPTPKEPKLIVDSPDKVKIVDLTAELIDLIVAIPPVEEIVLSTSELNIKARAALVNIICTTKTGGLLQPITGSGVIINEKGVILTNAHIAQYYLLKDYIVPDFLTCTVRTGSPAINTYKANLLFISSTWIKDNFQKIALSDPRGTGENDFALLLITDVTKPGAVLPDTFPYVAPDIRDLEPEVGDSVIVASYPAGFLGGISIQKELYAVTTITKVMSVFTFKMNTLDLFSIGGNIAAQKGSSGGGIVGKEGRLAGIVVTASDASQTDDRDLRAITLSHIDRSLEKESGISLNNYLLGGLKAKSEQFMEIVAPGLTVLLESALNSQN